jgi:hypothetical protein
MCERERERREREREEEKGRKRGGEMRKAGKGTRREEHTLDTGRRAHNPTPTCLCIAGD